MSIYYLVSTITLILFVLLTWYLLFYKRRKPKPKKIHWVNQLLFALQRNHQWHIDHDDYDGYEDSELQTENLAAIAIAKKHPRYGLLTIYAISLLIAGILLGGLAEHYEHPKPVTVSMQRQVFLMCWDDSAKVWNRCRNYNNGNVMNPIVWFDEVGNDVNTPGVVKRIPVEYLLSASGKGRVDANGKLTLERGTSQDEFLKFAFTSLLDYERLAIRKAELGK